MQGILVHIEEDLGLLLHLRWSILEQKPFHKNEHCGRQILTNNYSKDTTSMLFFKDKF